MAKKKRPGRWKPGESGNRNGRPKGVPNKATLEIKAFTQALFGRPKVQATVIKMAEAGTLPPAVWTAYLHYAYGKPKETIAHEGGDAPIRFTLNLDVTKPTNGHGA